MTTETVQRDMLGRFLPADPELAAIALIQRSLEPLDEEVRGRVIGWLWARFVKDSA